MEEYNKRCTSRKGGGNKHRAHHHHGSIILFSIIEDGWGLDRDGAGAEKGKANRGGLDREGS